MMSDTCACPTMEPLWKESIVFFQDKNGWTRRRLSTAALMLRYAKDHNGSTESTPGNMISACRINVTIAPTSSETLTSSTLLASSNWLKLNYHGNHSEWTWRPFKANMSKPCIMILILFALVNMEESLKREKKSIMESPLSRNETDGPQLEKLEK